MKELERRAMLGDEQAQRECTQQGIVLPCPWCKNVPKEEDVFPDYAGWIIYHDCKIAGHMRIKAKTRFNLILKWNTRHAPPIGRCKDCKHQGAGDSDICYSGMDEEFCSGFEPREEEAK